MQSEAMQEVDSNGLGIDVGGGVAKRKACSAIGSHCQQCGVATVSIGGSVAKG